MARRPRPWRLTLAALLVVGCAPAPPVDAPEPPAPPAPIPTGVAPEHLDIQGRSAPIAPGKQAVMIFVNGRQVINGTISTSAPQQRFRASYEGHDVVAECALRERVRCAISIDGAREVSD